jgi:hypothetical protein
MFWLVASHHAKLKPTASPALQKISKKEFIPLREDAILSAGATRKSAAYCTAAGY